MYRSRVIRARSPFLQGSRGEILEAKAKGQGVLSTDCSPTGWPSIPGMYFCRGCASFGPGESMCYDVAGTWKTDTHIGHIASSHSTARVLLCFSYQGFVPCHAGRWRQINGFWRHMNGLLTLNTRVTDVKYTSYWRQIHGFRTSNERVADVKLTSYWRQIHESLAHWKLRFWYF